MSKIKIARWRLLEILFLEFGYPIFEGIFSINTYLRWEHRLYGSKSYFDTFPTVYDTPSNSLGMRRYIFFVRQPS
jgi:hypothetical protein